MTPKHYQPYRAEGDLWEFTTPVGVVSGGLTRADALRVAANTELRHRQKAEGGPCAGRKALRMHFEKEGVLP